MTERELDACEREFRGYRLQTIREKEQLEATIADLQACHETARTHLSALVEQWREKAKEANREGAYVSQTWLEHCADQLAAGLGAIVELRAVSPEGKSRGE